MAHAYFSHPHFFLCLLAGKLRILKQMLTRSNLLKNLAHAHVKRLYFFWTFGGKIENFPTWFN